MSQPPAALTQAREEFLGMVDALRPQLHRYCARLTGSVIEGEDIVQDTLAKAFYALACRPRSRRSGHGSSGSRTTQAMDFLKSHGRKFTDVRDDFDDVAAFDERPDPGDRSRCARPLPRAARSRSGAPSS